MAANKDPVKKVIGPGDVSIWPTRDLVVALKGSLVLRSRKADEVQDKPFPSEELKALKERPRANIYRYTKGPELGNDGLGYGEIVSVNLVRRKKGKAGELEAHRARRTRSGQTALEGAEAIAANIKADAEERGQKIAKAESEANKILAKRASIKKAADKKAADKTAAKLKVASLKQEARRAARRPPKSGTRVGRT